MFKKINFVMCACVVVTLLATDVARAVEYDKIPPPSMTRDEENLARDFKRGKAPSTDAAKAALGKEVLAALAKFTNPDEAANYTQLRKNIEGFLKERSQSAEARAVIVNTLVTGASSIAARNNYSPAARINCLAILAMLDQKAETRIDNGIAAPQPAESAYPTLKGVAERPTMPYYLRAIALQGVERHASVYFKGGWDNQKKGEVVRLANSIVDSKPATALDAKAHAWLVRRGYDLLTTCGVATAYKTALAHVADAETLPSVRLAALGYLSSVDLARMPDADKSNYFVGLSHLTRSQLVSWYEYENDL
ncbi:MAG: hypothetical protein R3C53_28305, partial [Pirellulaceae bacterium]